MLVKCSTCQKDFDKSSSEIKRSVTGRHYCSKFCWGVWTSSVLKKGEVVHPETYCQSCFAPIERKNAHARKFCSKRCKGKYHMGNSYDRQRHSGYKRKLELIDKRGGKCERCGYCKNLSALSFHHLDPSTKSFNLDSRSIGNHSIKKIEEEFAKCIVLCMNCHTEEHHPQHTLHFYPVEKKRIINRPKVSINPTA